MIKIFSGFVLSIIILLSQECSWANAPNFSLLLTKQECTELNSKSCPILDSNLDAFIKLNAILYLGPSNWSIWVNNQKITPDASPEHIIIKDVTSDSVNLTWIEEQNEHDIHLMVNEAVDIADLYD